MRGASVPKGAPRVQKGPFWIENSPPFWSPFEHKIRPWGHLGPLWSASGSILEHLWTALFTGRLFSSISDPPGPPKCAIFIGGSSKTAFHQIHFGANFGSLLGGILEPLADLWEPKWHPKLPKGRLGSSS